MIVENIKKPKENKFYISVSSDDPDKIVNIELDSDSNTIWILKPSGELYSTTLWSILDELEKGMKNDNFLKE